MTGIYLLTLVGYESSNNYTISLLNENNSDSGKINGKKRKQPYNDLYNLTSTLAR